MAKWYVNLITGLVFIMSSTCVAAAQLSLFSEEEGVMLDLSEREWFAGIKNNKASADFFDVQPYSSPENERVSIRNEGPIVSIVNPESSGQHYTATIPVTLLVFMKSHQVPIDIDTLTVTGRRGIFSLDITDRLTPFLREAMEDENADYVIEGEIPKLRSGRYQVVLSLADRQGNYEERSIFLEVTKKE